jgi:hypothetical protein
LVNLKISRLSMPGRKHTSLSAQAALPLAEEMLSGAANSPRLPGAGLDVLSQPAQAAALLHHPLPLRILSALREADSGTGVARRMKLPRQTVNYQVRQRARARLLARAGRRMRRRMIEQCYVASARG